MFDIQPPSLGATVDQGDAVAPRDFTVAGFSVSGRVVDGAGDGVAGVSMLVAGEELASTDLNGRHDCVCDVCVMALILAPAPALALPSTCLPA